MPRNIGIIDQAVRSVLGLGFIAYLANDTNSVGELVFVGVVGAYLLVTALFLYCPLYGALGLSTYGRLDRSL